MLAAQRKLFRGGQRRGSVLSACGNQEIEASRQGLGMRDIEVHPVERGLGVGSRRRVLVGIGGGQYGKTLGKAKRKTAIATQEAALTVVEHGMERAEPVAAEIAAEQINLGIEKREPGAQRKCSVASPNQRIERVEVGCDACRLHVELVQGESRLGNVVARARRDT